MPRLFALDQNFPTPIVGALETYVFDADLVAVSAIDPRMSRLDDWELIVALHHDSAPWDGLITTDSSMLSLPRELAALMQTRLTLVVADDAGHDPIKATGLLFAHIGGICKMTDPSIPQIWRLNTKTQRAADPWEAFQRVANHQNRSTSALKKESWLSSAELGRDPLE